MENMQVLQLSFFSPRCEQLKYEMIIIMVLFGLQYVKQPDN